MLRNLTDGIRVPSEVQPSINAKHLQMMVPKCWEGKDFWKPRKTALSSAVADAPLREFLKAKVDMANSSFANVDMANSTSKRG